MGIKILNPGSNVAKYLPILSTTYATISKRTLKQVEYPSLLLWNKHDALVGWQSWTTKKI
jgi:hypothetical protein